ncbi:MAG TPA: hypothetical protein VHX11_08895 [Acidobacteriaceae bacterium]|jgi:RimJ/RimL family protein N-acetyltransferase|nr:hypothetical protein [Acidobacteriaceae bacterium]
MNFSLATDRDAIRRVITDPQLYPRMSDDFSPPPAAYEPPKEATFIEVRDGEELLGYFGLIEENAVCWKVHTCLLPSTWGPRAKQASREFIAWLWQNTRCQRLITDVPSDNRLALRFAKQGGLTEYGINPKSFSRGGVLLDQFCLGISKPEVLSCP